jgi:hypothetical protein
MHNSHEVISSTVIKVQTGQGEVMWTTRRHMLEARTHHNHRCENIKSYVIRKVLKICMHFLSPPLVLVIRTANRSLLHFILATLNYMCMSLNSLLSNVLNCSLTLPFWGPNISICLCMEAEDIVISVTRQRLMTQQTEKTSCMLWLQ